MRPVVKLRWPLVTVVAAADVDDVRAAWSETRRVYVVRSVRRRSLHLVERVLSAARRLSLVAVRGCPLSDGKRLASTVRAPWSQLWNADEARHLRRRRRLLCRRFDAISPSRLTECRLKL